MLLNTFLAFPKLLRTSSVPPSVDMMVNLSVWLRSAPFTSTGTRGFTWRVLVSVFLVLICAQEIFIIHVQRIYVKTLLMFICCYGTVETFTNCDIIKTASFK